MDLGMMPRMSLSVDYMMLVLKMVRPEDLSHDAVCKNLMRGFHDLNSFFTAHQLIKS